MTDKEIFEKAKAVIGENNILDYRPAVFKGAENTMIDFECCIPNTIMIWLKNGDCIWYRHNE